MKSQSEKALLLKALNESSETFIIPNAWDIASTKIITSFNFKAIATSSAAIALSQGKSDNKVSLSKTIQIHKQICEATHLPVSADFGYGFSNSPDEIYENTLRLAKSGVVGASLEDVAINKVIDKDLAIQKVKAMKAAANELNFPFSITARSDNFFIGISNLKDTISRLQAYQLAGADVLFAPGINTIDQIKTILSNTDKPLNVLVGLPNFNISIETLKELGVQRISIGALLAKHSFSTIISTLQSIKSNDISSLISPLTFSQILSKL